MLDGPYTVINREGNYYVLDMETKLRVSPPLPSMKLAQEFQKISEQFGPPSTRELLDPSFDVRAWMMRVSSDLEDDAELDDLIQEYNTGPKVGGGGGQQGGAGGLEE